MATQQEALFAGAEPTGPTAADLRKRIGALLSNCGTPGTCKGCGATIYWMAHRNGKNCPYDPDGTSHFTTCPEARRFSRKGARP